MGKHITIIATNVGEVENFVPDANKLKFFAERLLIWCPEDSKYRKKLEALAGYNEKTP